MNSDDLNYFEDQSDESAQSIYLTYQYRLLPLKSEHKVLEQILEDQRLLSNGVLSSKIDIYNKTKYSTKENVSCFEHYDDLKKIRAYELSELKPENYSYAKVPVNLSRWTIKKVHQSFEQFFTRVSKGNQNVGFPRYKSFGRFKSFGFNEFSGVTLNIKNKEKITIKTNINNPNTLTNSNNLKNDCENDCNEITNQTKIDSKNQHSSNNLKVNQTARIYFKGLPHAKGIRIHLHRPLPSNFTSEDIKSCVFTKDDKGWLVSLNIKIKKINSLNDPNNTDFTIQEKQIFNLIKLLQLNPSKTLELKNLENNIKNKLTRLEDNSNNKVNQVNKLKLINSKNIKDKNKNGNNKNDKNISLTSSKTKVFKQMEPKKVEGLKKLIIKDQAKCISLRQEIKFINSKIKTMTLELMKNYTLLNLNHIYNHNLNPLSSDNKFQQFYKSNYLEFQKNLILQGSFNPFNKNYNFKLLQKQIDKEFLNHFSNTNVDDNLKEEQNKNQENKNLLLSNPSFLSNLNDSKTEFLSKLLQSNLEYLKKIILKVCSDYMLAFDLGVSENNYLVLSDQSVVPSVKSIKNFEKHEKAIKELQQSIAKERKGSNKRNKLIKQLRSIHTDLFNIKDTYNHTISNSLIHDTLQNNQCLNVKKIKLSKKGLKVKEIKTNKKGKGLNKNNTINNTIAEPITELHFNGLLQKSLSNGNGHTDNNQSSNNQKNQINNLNTLTDSNTLINPSKKYYFYVGEELDLKRMMKSAKGTVENPGVNVKQKAGLNRSFANVASGKIINQLTYKAEEADKCMIWVNPYNTTQMCSKCDAIIKKSLKQRTHHCLYCGLQLDRDLNASYNIKKKGLQKLKEDLDLLSNEELFKFVFSEFIS